MELSLTLQKRYTVLLLKGDVVDQIMKWMKRMN